MQLLNSWKEIASYLGRGIRTVQRWEKLGLPIRRIGEGRRAPVVAYAADIDNWMHNAQTHGFAVAQPADQLPFRGALSKSVEHSRALRAQMVTLRNDQHIALMQLAQSVAALEKSCQPHTRKHDSETSGLAVNKSSRVA